MLVQSDVEVRFADDFSQKINARIRECGRGEDVSKVFESSLSEALTGEKDIPLISGKIMIVGLNGAGKTTTVAKLARMLSSEGLSVGIVAADLRRPGAIEQVKILADKAQVPVFTSPNPDIFQLLEESKEWIKDYQTVFFDTGGRQETETMLMKELSQMAMTIDPDVVLYICDGAGGQQVARSGRLFDQSIGIDGIVVTKLDGDAVGGAVLSLIGETGAPVVYCGVGEKIGDIEVFDPLKISKRIMGTGGLGELISKIENGDEWEIGADYEKNLDINEFLKTVKAVRKLGSIATLAKATGWVTECEGRHCDENLLFSKIEAIINSMTSEERSNPDLLSCQWRIQRIAGGAGVEIDDVLEFLGRFGSMRDVLQGA